MIAALQPKTRQILGVNQQAYQALKASMSLNLRRQLLIAVCDNVVLQNQLSAQLERDLAQETWFSPQFDAGPPKAISLSLERLIFDTEDAHLPRQVAHWVREVVLSKDRFAYDNLPQVQVVGIEQMTRQPAIVQSHFLRSLEQIEALLPRLNTSLLVWVPWPWLRTIQSSAPTFWKWRNAVFEFVSDPTPALMPSDKSRLPEGQAALPGQLGGHQVGSRQLPGQSDRRYHEQAFGSSMSGSSMPGSMSGSMADPIAEQLAEQAALQASNNRPTRPPTSNDYPAVIAHDDVVALYGETDDAEIGDGDQPVLESIVNWDAVDVSSVSMQSKQLAPQSPPQSQPQSSSALQRTAPNALPAQSQPDQQRDPDVDADLLAAIQAASSPQAQEPVDAQGFTQSQRRDIQAREAARLEAQRLRAHAALQQEARQREIAQKETEQREAERSASTQAEDYASEAQRLADREALLRSQYDQLNEQLSGGAELGAGQDDSDQAYLEDMPSLDAPAAPDASAGTQDTASIHGAADDYFEVGRNYRQRIEAGERGLDMIEPAIAAYEGGLRCLNGPHPDWGSGLNDLGTLYWLKAQQLNDQQQVIDCMRHSVQLYSEALTKIDVEQEVNMACQLYSNLGAVYSMLATQIDPVEYFKQAADAYQNSISLCDLSEDPEEFATLQNSLGSVYWKLSHYEQEDEQIQLYLRQAITAYEQALLGYVPTQRPLDYAAVQNNLGITYWSLAKHAAPVAALKNAIAAYRDALNYRTPDNDAAACAITYNNLALAYWDLSKDEDIDLEHKIRYQRNAITAFEAALQTAATVGSLSQSDSAAIYHCLGDVHAQMAENAPSLTEVADSLQKSLYSYVKAIEGMPTESAVFQARLTAIIANLKSHQEHLGLASQQAALNRVPSHLVSEVMQAL